MDSTNRLAKFLNSIDVDSNVKKEIKEFPHLTVIAYIQELNYSSIETHEKLYIVNLIIDKNENLQKHNAYEGLNLEKANEEYNKLVNLINSQNEEYFANMK